jgi:hypothetical protein
MVGEDEPIRSMTLGQHAPAWHGVRGLHATRQHCGHERAVNRDGLPDDATVPSFGPRMRCSRYGRLGATTVPNWIERANRLPGGARCNDVVARPWLSLPQPTLCRLELWDAQEVPAPTGPGAWCTTAVSCRLQCGLSHRLDGDAGLRPFRGGDDTEAPWQSFPQYCSLPRAQELVP